MRKMYLSRVRYQQGGISLIYCINLIINFILLERHYEIPKEVGLHNFNISAYIRILYV